MEYIALEGEKIYNNTEIANQFNIFFTEIGPKLADKIKIVDNITFKHFLRTPTNNTFPLEQVNENTILNIIKGLTSKTSCDSKTTSYDNKPNFQHGYTGIFPDELKIAKVIHIFKKGDKSNINNFRPISILPVI